MLEARQRSMRQRGQPVELDAREERFMIPLLDLQAQYAALQPELDAAVLEVIASGAVRLGPQVAAFESGVRRLLRRRACRGASAPAPRRCIWRCSRSASGRATR